MLFSPPFHRHPNNPLKNHLLNDHQHMANLRELVASYTDIDGHPHRIDPADVYDRNLLEQLLFDLSDLSRFDDVKTMEHTMEKIIQLWLRREIILNDKIEAANDDDQISPAEKNDRKNLYMSEIYQMCEDYQMLMQDRPRVVTAINEINKLGLCDRVLSYRHGCGLSCVITPVDVFDAERYQQLMQLITINQLMADTESLETTMADLISLLLRREIEINELMKTAANDEIKELYKSQIQQLCKQYNTMLKARDALYEFVRNRDNQDAVGKVRFNVEHFKRWVNLAQITGVL